MRCRGKRSAYRRVAVLCGTVLGAMRVARAGAMRLVATWLVLGVACGPLPGSRGRAPDATELQRLLALLTGQRAPGAYSAFGHAHFESSEGEVQGEIEVRADPPQRAWAQLRTSALFSLVGERLVLSLPGDGYLVLYQQRGDDLQRLPFADSQALDFSLGGGVPELLALLAGRVPWPSSPADAARNAQVVSAAGQRLEYTLALPPSRGGGSLRLLLDGPELRRLDWWENGRQRLEVEFDRWRDIEGAPYPTRLRVRAPEAHLRGELSFERLELRPGFEERDFEVGTLKGTSPWRPS